MRIIFILITLSFHLFSFAQLKALPDTNNIDTNSAIVEVEKKQSKDKNIISYRAKDNIEDKIKSYQYDNRWWTTHGYPILTIVLSLIAVLAAFITIKTQSQSAKEEREHLNNNAKEERVRLDNKWEHEVRERQKEQAETITRIKEEKEKQRIEAKLKTDSNTFDELMKYLEKDKGTVSASTYFAISLKSMLNIEGYPKSFENIASGVQRILLDFFAYDAEYFTKPHHAHLHNQILNNIPEFLERTKNMSEMEVTQFMQRYYVALLKVMQSNEVGPFYSSWVAYIDTKDPSYLYQQKQHPNETLIATIIINNLSLLYKSCPEGHLIRLSIKTISKDAYGNDDLLNRLIL